MEMKKVIEGMKSIFPEGKGGASNKNKEVFLASAEGDDSEDELQDVMEVIADNVQTQDGIEEEDALEAFENYAEVRRKMLEKKRARGFTAVEGPKSRLSGLMTGKLEQNKARARCHLCKKQGYWKRECPLAVSKAGGKGQGRSTASTSGPTRPASPRRRPRATSTSPTRRRCKR